MKKFICTRTSAPGVTEKIWRNNIEPSDHDSLEYKYNDPTKYIIADNTSTFIFNKALLEEFPEYNAGWSVIITNTGLTCFYTASKAENNFVIYDMFDGRASNAEDIISSINPDISMLLQYNFIDQPLNVRKVNFKNNKFKPEMSYMNGEGYIFINCDNISNEYILQENGFFMSSGLWDKIDFTEYTSGINFIKDKNNSEDIRIRFTGINSWKFSKLIASVDTSTKRVKVYHRPYLTESNFKSLLNSSNFNKDIYKVDSNTADYSKLLVKADDHNKIDKVLEYLKDKNGRIAFDSGTSGKREDLSHPFKYDNTEMLFYLDSKWGIGDSDKYQSFMEVNEKGDSDFLYCFRTKDCFLDGLKLKEIIKDIETIKFFYKPLFVFRIYNSDGSLKVDSDGATDDQKIKINVNNLTAEKYEDGIYFIDLSSVSPTDNSGLVSISLENCGDGYLEVI